MRLHWSDQIGRSSVPRMEFGILGPLEVRTDSGAVAIGGAKPRALLALLLLHANEAVHPERLALALWDEDAPPSAAKTAQIYVSRLRKALADPEILVNTPAGYRLRVRAGELDADRFAAALEAGRQALAAGRAEHAAVVLREALALWRGPPLSDLTFAPFAEGAIVRLQEQRLVAIEERIEADLTNGRHAVLVGELRQLVAVHPTRERFVSQLMLALYRCGQQAEALETFHAARRVLISEIGVEPGPQLREMQQAVLAQDDRLQIATGVAPGTVGGAPASLPAPATVLFGRDADTKRVAGLVRGSETRLVTLVGPGGVGKTRLAIAIAARLTQEFADGSRFVSLATIGDHGDLASAIAHALGAPARAQDSPTAALHRFLADRELLLVLDNFEHLVAAAPLVAELLDTCRPLKVLITSRQPIRVTAERLYPVLPLQIPDDSDDASARELERYGSVAMFVDRARAREPAFTLDETNGRHVREICRRLDGLPLALELAAARIGLLAPAELARRLDRALSVLSGGARDAPARQRTLRATIDWSFALLSETERDAFTQFAVFAGGATVAAAEQVSGTSLDTLDALVAKQLLTRVGDRLMMLETVREYALERLTASGGIDPVHERLADWCVSFWRQATPHLVKADRLRWLPGLDAELPNILAALGWAIDTQRGELALQLAAAAGPYWWHTDQLKHGLPWMDAALAQARDASPRARANALFYRAQLINLRQVRRYMADLRASLECFRACNDDVGITRCLAHLTDAAAWHGQFEEALAFSREAMQSAERVDDEGLVALVLMKHAHTAATYEDIARLAGPALKHLRRAGDVNEIAYACMAIGYMAIVERQYEDALTWLCEGLESARQLGKAGVLFHLRNNEGLVRLFLDEVDAAADAFGEALALCRAAGAEELVDETFYGVAAVAARRGDFARAARLVGAAERHETLAQAPGEALIRSRLIEEMLAAPRQSYGAENWQRASAEGASLTVYDAIDLALRRGRFAPTANDQTGLFQTQAPA